MDRIEAHTLNGDAIVLEGTIVSESQLFHSSASDVPVQVIKTVDGFYHVVVNDIVRHGKVSAEGAMRALSIYLHNVTYRARKMHDAHPFG